MKYYRPVIKLATLFLVVLCSTFFLSSNAEATAKKTLNAFVMDPSVSTQPTPTSTPIATPVDPKIQKAVEICGNKMKNDADRTKYGSGMGTSCFVAKQKSGNPAEVDRQLKNLHLQNNKETRDNNRPEQSLAEWTIFDPIAKAFAGSTSKMLLSYQSEWARDHSAVTTNQSQQISKDIKGLVMPLAGLVLLASITWQAIVIMITKRSQPLVDVIRGMFTFVFWSGLAIAGTVAAVNFSDGVAHWIFDEGLRRNSGSIFDSLDDAFSGNFDKLKQQKGGGVFDAVGAMFLSTFVWFATMVLKVSFIFRDVSLVILAGVLTLAASGALTNATRQWLFSIISWMLSLIAYKPAVSLTYFVAGRYAIEGNKADASVEQFFMAFIAILLSACMLPLMTRFFTWASGQATGGGSASSLQTFTTTYAQYGPGRR